VELFAHNANGSEEIIMNTAHTVGVSAIVACVVLALAGCGQESEAADVDSTVQGPRFVNTEVCNAAAWIRERAPEGLCTSALDVDDDMSLRRLHLERERSEP
jgi:hypothetical protein